MTEARGGASRLRHAWRENLRQRSEVSWGGFAVETAVLLVLNGVAAGLLVATGNRHLLGTLAVVCGGFIAGHLAFRLVVLAVFRRRPGRREPDPN